MWKGRNGEIPEEHNSSNLDCECWPVITLDLYDANDSMFKKYYPWVEKPDREDHAQDVLTDKILRKERVRQEIHDMAPTKKRWNCLYTISHNAYIDVLRKLFRQRQWGREVYGDFDQEDDRSDHQWQQMELEQFLQHALAPFSDRDRAVYKLWKIEQCTPKEICETMKIGRTTFYKNCYNMHKVVEEYFQRERNH